IDYCYSLKFCLSKFETTSQNKNHSVRKWLLFSINLFIHERDARASWRTVYLHNQLNNWYITP
ncbi:MAG TPA: hypothetical protein VF677_08590, partial [Flavobacterium sp.]